jgi:hypothetical protein
MCWGANYNGQVGDGSMKDRTEPVEVSGLASGAAAITAGDVHTCARIMNGAVKCWGANPFGQVGDGTKTDRPEPVEVTGLASGITAIDAGRSHTCALTGAGAVKCWGLDGNGQLGIGTITWRSTPVNALILFNFLLPMLSR